MAIRILRDLRGLRVQVIHQPDDEGVELVEHLRRIGCTVEAQWPIPDASRRQQTSFSLPSTTKAGTIFFGSAWPATIKNQL